MHTGRRDGIAITKRRRQDFHSDDVTDLATASERSQLKDRTRLCVIAKRRNVVVMPSSRNGVLKPKMSKSYGIMTCKFEYMDRLGMAAQKEVVDEFAGL
ncbi:hypothetical protein Tco_0363416 [Tanacetum coccineum]